MLNYVASGIREKTAHQKGPTYLWKTISGAGCGPIGSITLPDTAYSWNKFPKYDDMAGATMSSIGVPIVNVSMLYQRGDAHPGSDAHPGKDCLHFCAPGPLEVWPRVLSHVLRWVLK